MAMRFEYDGFVVNVTDVKIEKKIKKFLAKLQKQKANPRQHKMWSINEVCELQELMVQGLSIKEVAKALGRTVSGVNIKLWHLHGRPSGGQPAAKAPEVVEL